MSHFHIKCMLNLPVYQVFGILLSNLLQNYAKKKN